MPLQTFPVEPRHERGAGFAEFHVETVEPRAFTGWGSTGQTTEEALARSAANFYRKEGGGFSDSADPKIEAFSPGLKGTFWTDCAHENEI